MPSSRKGLLPVLPRRCHTDAAGCDPSRMSCYSLVPRCRGALHLCRAAPARCCCCDAGCVCLLLASQVLQVAHRGQQVVLHNSQACRGAPTLLQQRHLLQHTPLEAYDAVHLLGVEHGRDRERERLRHQGAGWALGSLAVVDAQASLGASWERAVGATATHLANQLHFLVLQVLDDAEQLDALVLERKQLTLNVLPGGPQLYELVSQHLSLIAKVILQQAGPMTAGGFGKVPRSRRQGGVHRATVLAHPTPRAQLQPWYPALLHVLYGMPRCNTPWLLYNNPQDQSDWKQQPGPLVTHEHCALLLDLPCHLFHHLVVQETLVRHFLLGRRVVRRHVC